MAMTANLLTGARSESHAETEPHDGIGDRTEGRVAKLSDSRRPNRRVRVRQNRSKEHEMKYMMFVCTDTEPDPPTGDPELDEVEPWVKRHDAGGARLMGEALRPIADATTVRKRDGKVLVTDGPFAETREWIAGFDILECADLDEAIEIASQHPMARFGRLELRPFLGDGADGRS
jgi:hypothetical protein